MRRYLYLCAIALIALSFTSQLAPAFKPTVQSTRTLSVRGKTQDGNAYSGVLQVTPKTLKNAPSGFDGATLKWNVEGTPYSGIGLSTENILTATWGGKSCSLIVYAVEGKKLTGVWTTGSQSLGSEFATQTSGRGLPGTYSVNGTTESGGAYKGSLTITDRGGVYQFSWDVGTKYEGIGIRKGDLVSVAWAGSSKDNCGVIQYEITNNGLANGIWGTYGTSGLGSEQGVLK